MREAKFTNGDLLKDKVTGLDGVAMVVAFYSTGCIHYGLQPQRINTDGSIPDWTWLDESRLVKSETARVSFDVSPDSASGPMPSGPQM
ncbi:MAG TPA: hypothetical protein VI911_07755 [Patescibacteria group bacterium]|nr:hypothetical protein [Patescibacteria group bacterium]